MRLSFSQFAWVCLSACALAGPAFAQAPISYVGQGTPQYTAALAGGGETSYGYGASQPRRPAATIDLRRAGSARATPVADTPAPETPQTPPETSQQRPPWLEQERVGPPYQAQGQWYVPTVEPGYEQTGVASWYGSDFHGQRTASGEMFDQDALTAAHPTLPIPSLVQVTNLENGREVIVRVNDRGPFVHSRLIDVSHRTAEVLGFANAGHARVHVRYLGPAPRHVAADGAPAPEATHLPALAPDAPPADMEAPTAEQGPTSLLPPPAPTEQVLAGAEFAPPMPEAGGYVVQVGAFSDLTNAHRVRDAAAAAGPVTVDIRGAQGGELFRVRVGPWQSREEAEAARRQLAAIGYAEAVVATR